MWKEIKDWNKEIKMKVKIKIIIDRNKNTIGNKDKIRIGIRNEDTNANKRK